MTKVISIYNQRKGTGKTTTTFNLGWKLAEMGHKVLMVDADPQCNLTQLCVDSKYREYMESFYEKNDDIYRSIKPVLDNYDLSKIQKDNSVIKPCKTKNKNLDFIAGNIDFGEVDIFLSCGLDLSLYMRYMSQYIGVISYKIRETAEEYKHDFVLIDHSPSVNALNQTLLMGSNYFIIPTTSDFYCLQAISSLSRLIPRWVENFKNLKDNRKLRYPLPEYNPIFLGITNNFTEREMTDEDGDCMYEIDKKVRVELVPKLKEHNMILESKMRDLMHFDRLNTFFQKSYEYSIPAYSLTEKELGEVFSFENTKKNLEILKNAYKNLAIDIINKTK
jgi:cellulose biosynthesis protein BcsQ